MPSHFWYDELKKHFPEAYFVSIGIPKDIETFKQKLYDRFYSYKTKNILELAGECENRIREYNPKASVKDVMKFTAKIFKMENISFGDIRCYAKNLEPTAKNKKMLIDENRWRAQRYGIEKSLVDFGKSKLVSYNHLADELIDLVKADAKILQCDCGSSLSRRNN